MVIFMEDTAKIIDKINKLFILAENNANPGEKRSARAKAYQLMNQYNIDDADVPFFAKQKVTETAYEAPAPEPAPSYAAQPAAKQSAYMHYAGNIFSTIFMTLKNFIKIPLVWQSIFVILWFAMMFNVAKFQMDAGNHEIAWAMLLGSLVFFWHWIRNFIYFYLFMVFLYFVGTSLWEYLFA